MKNLTILWLAFAAMLLASEARAEPLRGDNFIEVMKDNTLTGKTQAGINYSIYFVEGGEVSYQEQGGRADRGTWSIDPDGDVCIKWKAPSDLTNECYKVDVQGSKVTWSSKTGSGHGGLRGEVVPMDMAKSQ
jgi:hypothetical protein